VISVRVQTGAKEPIGVLAIDSAKSGLVDLTNLMLRIRRVSDDYHFDWSDNTFKAAPTQLLVALSQVDKTNSPGAYKLDYGVHTDGFDTGQIANAVDDDTYHLLVTQEGSPQNADNRPWEGELKVGDWVDYFDQSISDNASPTEVRAELVGFGLDHLVSVNPGVVPPASGTYIRQLLDGQDVLLAQGYSLQQNWSYHKNLDQLLGQVWVEYGGLIITAPISCSVTWYDSNEVAIFTVTDAAPDARGVFLLSKDTPGLQTNKPYYAEAMVEVPGYGTVKAIKGAFTVG